MGSSKGCGPAAEQMVKKKTACSSSNCWLSWSIGRIILSSCFFQSADATISSNSNAQKAAWEHAKLCCKTCGGDTIILALSAWHFQVALHTKSSMSKVVFLRRHFWCQLPCASSFSQFINLFLCIQIALLFFWFLLLLLDRFW